MELHIPLVLTTSLSLMGYFFKEWTSHVSVSCVSRKEEEVGRTEMGGACGSGTDRTLRAKE